MSFRDSTFRADYFSEQGAEALVDRIKAVWARKGLAAPNLVIVRSTGIGPQDSEMARTRFDVRSDMVNGLPLEARQ